VHAFIPTNPIALLICDECIQLCVDMLFEHGIEILGRRMSDDYLARICSPTIHDLRRSVATGMAKIGILPHVIEAVLNQISGHKVGVAGIYNHNEPKTSPDWRRCRRHGLRLLFCPIPGLSEARE
jgi:hypothetical protein